ncbi:MAG: RNA-directed DNA polymerase [Gammaproteobacteria bacterium]|nr:RNA-directed DNA polymerase [Gammaproteobacteria bacterium]MCH9743771.1 RNA-directed DNA polymerase [Gammaproteobacteria bacterium]
MLVECESDVEIEFSSILDASNQEAKEFFISQGGFCNYNLPSYITFEEILKESNDLCCGVKISDCQAVNPASCDEINHTMPANRDGKYSWRPMSLINPILYVELVNVVTDKDSWDFIKNKFKQREYIRENIRCESLPKIRKEQKSISAAQIKQWYRRVELISVELALDFSHLYRTDITNCYGSIYTHSIAWALHGKDKIKSGVNRNNGALVGNLIDKSIRGFSYGETNGIPQGSVLMDFIAEIVLGYADLLIFEKIRSTSIDDYKIIRYRDDYRIFVNNPHDGEIILKVLTEVLIDLKLKLNSQKTSCSNDIVLHSIKDDKIYISSRKLSGNTLYEHLLSIYDVSKKFPNSGALVKLLLNLNRLIEKGVSRKYLTVFISMVSEISINNPKSYPVCCAILSRLLVFYENTDIKKSIVDKVAKKLGTIPNAGLLQVWLQRITLPFYPSHPYEEKLCKIVKGEDLCLWKFDWLHEKHSSLFDHIQIIDEEKLKSIPNIIPEEEVDIFSY